jgi:VCBS repeat-containing protein
MLDAIHLLWNEGGAVLHRHSIDGAAFSPATALTVAGGDLLTSLSISGAGNLVNAAWTQRDASEIAHGPFFRRSTDGGAGFGPALDLADGSDGAADVSIAGGQPVKLAWADTLNGDALVRREIACSVSWLNPVAGLWSDAAKWSTGAVPTAPDDVCISVAGTYTVTVHGTRDANSVVVGSEAGSGRVTLLVEGTRPALSNTFHATLNVGNGITNFHTVAMTGTGVGAVNATIAIGAGGLTNAAAALLQTLQGSSGARALNGDLINHGSVDLQHSAQFSSAGARYENHGTFTVASGDTLALTGGRMIQADGTLTVTGSLTGAGSAFDFNGGVIAGTPILLTNGALHVAPQSSGNGAFVLRSASSLSGQIAAAQVVTIQGWRPQLSNTFHAAVTAAPGTINAGTINLTSEGAGVVDARLHLSGTLINAASGVIQSQIGDGGGRLITGTLVNNGTLEITQSATITGTLTNTNAVNVSGGVILNVSATSVIEQDAGAIANHGEIRLSGATFRFNGGTTSGNAVLLTNGALAFGPGSGGAGTFRLRGIVSMSGDMASGQRVIIEGWRPQSSDTTHASVTTTGMANGGTIEITGAGVAAVNATLIVAGGALTVTDTGSIVTLAGAGGARTINGSLVNHGTVDIRTNTNINGNQTNHGSVVIAGLMTVEAGSSVFTQAAGSVTGANLTMVGGTFHFNGGSVLNTPPILTSSNLHFGAGSSGAGAFRLRAASSLTGNLAADQRVVIEGWRPQLSLTTHAVITVNGSMVNAGRLQLTGQGGTGPVNASLIISGGTLTTAAGGAIEIQQGDAGARTMTGTVVNHGTLHVAHPAHFSGVFTNHHAVTIDGLDTLTLNAGATFTQHAGTVTGTGLLEVNGGTFNFNGGAMAGTAPTLSSSTLNFGSGAITSGTLRMFGSGVLTGNIPAGVGVHVEGHRPQLSLTTHAVTTLPGNVSNAGTIRLTGSGAGAVNATLEVAAGAVLTNAAGGVIESHQGAGGVRTLRGNVDNHGSITLPVPATLAAGTLRNIAPATIAGGFGSSLTLNAGTVFHGTGTITTNIVNAGNFHAGLSPGSLIINGSYTQTGSGIFHAEIGGSDPGTGYDQVAVSGAATLAGTLRVSLANGFCGTGAYDVLTYASRSGDFAIKQGLNQGSLQFATEPLPTFYRLNATGACITGPIANPDAYSVAEDTALAVPAPGVLGNDTDPQPGTVLTAAVATPPANGTLALNSDGSFTYTPNANFSGTDAFTYAASDGTEGSIPATVTITVNAVNDPPVAVADTYQTQEDVELIAGAGSGVLTNDTDPDGPASTATLLSAPAHGTLTLAADGTFSYAPNANFNGGDSFTYQVDDGAGGTATAAVTLVIEAVNDAPSAADASATTNEEVAVEIVLTANDVDSEGLTFTVAGGPANGTLTQNGDRVTYTPAPDFFGTDSFTFVANDGLLDGNLATVTITVAPINDAPTASDASVNTDEDEEVTIDLTGADVDGDTLSFTIVSGPSHGTLLQLGGQVIYTPALDHAGGDSFTFKVNDGTVDSNHATVAITIAPVNDAPSADDATAVTNEDEPVSVTLSGADVDSPSLQYVIVDGPQHGTLSQSGQTITYTPAPNYFGDDGFTFKVNDGERDSNVATVAISVTPVNDLPTATGASASATEDQPVDIIVSGDDLDGDDLSFIMVTGPQHGTVSLSAATFTYTPAPNYAGGDSFTFKVNDGSSDSAEATVQITVAAVNDAPTATGAAAQTNEDTAVTLTLQGNDADSSALTYHIVDAPQHGSFSQSGGTIVYTPAPNYFGNDSFTFTVHDGALDSNVATVSLTIVPVNDPPTLSGVQNLTVPVGGVASFTVSGADVEDAAVALEASGLFGGAQFNPATGHFSWTPAAAGTFSFTFTARDSGGLTASQAAVITVTAASTNRPPSCANARASVIRLWSPNGRWVPVFIKGVTDPDGDRVRIRITSITVNERGAEDDYKVIWNTLALLRAKRSGHHKDGRLYTIHFTATDEHGASCSGNVVVKVDHDKGKKHRKDDDGDHDGCDDRDHDWDDRKKRR